MVFVGWESSGTNFISSHPSVHPIARRSGATPARRRCSGEHPIPWFRARNSITKDDKRKGDGDELTRQALTGNRRTQHPCPRHQADPRRRFILGKKFWSRRTATVPEEVTLGCGTRLRCPSVPHRRKQGLRVGASAAWTSLVMAVVRVLCRDQLSLDARLNDGAKHRDARQGRLLSPKHTASVVQSLNLSISLMDDGMVPCVNSLASVTLSWWKRGHEVGIYIYIYIYPAQWSREWRNQLAGWRRACGEFVTARACNLGDGEDGSEHLGPPDGHGAAARNAGDMWGTGQGGLHGSAFPHAGAHVGLAGRLSWAGGRFRPRKCR
jgi:hypothetical protein